MNRQQRRKQQSAQARAGSGPAPDLEAIRRAMEYFDVLPPLPQVTAGPGASEALLERFSGQPDRLSVGRWNAAAIPIVLDDDLPPGVVAVDPGPGGRRTFYAVDGTAEASEAAHALNQEGTDTE